MKTEERPKRDVCAMLVNTNGSRKVVKWFCGLEKSASRSSPGGIMPGDGGVLLNGTRRK
ncbi:MAG: hypothetical protein ACTS4W_00830 [Candidatus Hodgkinia cicadicola]